MLFAMDHQTVIRIEIPGLERFIQALTIQLETRNELDRLAKELTQSTEALKVAVVAANPKEKKK